MRSCASVCRKSFAFSQTLSLFQMEKRASPLFQAFFPLQPRFFLNEAAVFRQSQHIFYSGFFHALSPPPEFYFRQHRIIPDGGARRKNFCEMLQKAQGILDGLPSIFGKYHGNFWRDAPSEQPRVNDAVLP